AAGKRKGICESIFEYMFTVVGKEKPPPVDPEAAGASLVSFPVKLWRMASRAGAQRGKVRYSWHAARHRKALRNRRPRSSARRSSLALRGLQACCGRSRCAPEKALAGKRESANR